MQRKWTVTAFVVVLVFVVLLPACFMPAPVQAQGQIVVSPGMACSVQFAAQIQHAVAEYARCKGSSLGTIPGHCYFRYVANFYSEAFQYGLCRFTP